MDLNEKLPPIFVSPLGPLRTFDIIRDLTSLTGMKISWSGFWIRRIASSSNFIQFSS